MISCQRTIKNSVSSFGVGLHSGENIKITLNPAETNTGIIFRRIDFNDKKSIINASYDNVTTTNLGTTIANKYGVSVATIEHLMSAVWGTNIDNLYIDINGPEVPIMDGSAYPFIFLLQCAGIQEQNESKKILKIIKEFKFHDKATNKYVTIKPSDSFNINLNIEFQNQIIGKQNYYFEYKNNSSFQNELARARTFGFKEELDHLYNLGLIKGGSLDNAIVVDKDKILNKTPLRYNEEFARHKILDFIGDIYLSGYHIIGGFSGNKTGHELNNKLLHELFKKENCDHYCIVS